jgi:exodeoxyribonuclease V gamma subunit
MLILHESNRLERLADDLAEVLRVPLRPALAPETIAVQSNGMARWLRMRLADRLGVSANIEFPLPSSLVWQLFGRVLPDVPDRSPYEREVLTWRLMGMLPALVGAPPFAPLRAYLADAEDDLRRHQLASRIADLFDQYLIYRPDWVLDWERGSGDSWHAPLWRALVRSIGGSHRVRVQERFLAALAGVPSATDALPARLCLFGIPTLPPAQLEVFARLADALDVHLFWLNPCRQFWAEIRSEREIARRVKDRDPRELYLEAGNSLLAACGKQGRDFLALLLDCDPHAVGEFEEPGEDSLLHCLQTDILHLRNRGEAGAPRTRIRVDDRSVQVHSCHSPMREVEVLYDQLLALFEADPALEPGDVAVMTPDIEAYAPFIEAVFGTAAPDRRIPFSIADRRRRTESPAATAFFSLLEIVEGRFGADQVLGLLEIEPVRRRFGIAEADLPEIQDWIRATGVRWGVDGESRAALDLPVTAEHTWRAGLDRLLLGYALPAGGRRLFGGILPYDEIEGAASRVLGRLCSFAEALFAAREELAHARPVAEWADLLLRLLDRFLEADEDEEEQVADIRRAAATLAEEAGRADFGDAVSLAVARSALQAALKEGRGGGRFLAGRVTFCAMVPMRSVPFQVVCLIGLNDGSYPRSRRAPGFDLMSDDARTGDRSRRDDDRYLFLEAVVSARRVLYLSYVGQSNRDNASLPPSVLVSELLEYVECGFAVGEEQTPVRESLLARHPLHAFSPRYFRAGETAPSLFSFSEEYCEASRRRKSGGGPEPFLAVPLAEPSEEWRRLDPARFIRFFQQPTRYLVRERLRIHLEEQEGLLESREPFVLDGLAAYTLRRELLDLRLAGESLEGGWEIARAGGRLPQGRVGEVCFDEEAEKVQAFARRVEVRRAVPRLDPIPVDCDLGPIRLTGWLTGVSSPGLLEYRLTAAKPKDWIALWLRHLLLNSLRPPGVTPESCWLGEDEEILLGPVDDPLPRLAALAEIFWAGLSQPLHLFSEAGFAYAERVHKDQGEGRALSAARTVWVGNEFSKKAPEGQDPYHRLVFRNLDPLDADFARLSREVFLPMLEHRRP